MKNIYLLKDLAQVTGHSTYTLKYYIQLGLFKEIGRSPVTNFRYFDDDTVESLKDIRKMQNDGFSLKEIKMRLSE